MESLFEAGRVVEVKERLARLRPESARQWGTMSPAQAVEHCSRGIEMALGEVNPKRMLLGRLIGGIIKPMALKEGAPMRRNSPTMPELVVAGEPGLDTGFEGGRERLNGMVDRFVAAGTAGCSTHPHSFFGKMTGEEWGTLMYKHLDHHLRQFGV